MMPAEHQLGVGSWELGFRSLPRERRRVCSPAVGLLILAGVLTAALVLSVGVQLWRRPGTSRRGKAAFVAAVIVSLAGAGAIYAWQRSPDFRTRTEMMATMERGNVDVEVAGRAARYRAIHVTALITGGVLAAVAILTLMPRVRSWRGFPAMHSGWACLAVLVVGYGAGTLGRKQDEALTRARASQIAGALERYRADAGQYPPTLGTLTPLYMMEVPRPHVGWTDQEFGYVSLAGERYELSYMSARDVMTWRHPRRMPGWIPRYTLWEE